MVLPLVQRGPGYEGFGLREDTLDSLLCILHSRMLQVGARGNGTCRQASDMRKRRPAALCSRPLESPWGRRP